MIYLDSSVAMASVFAEAQQPRPGFWLQQLVASRLLEYEMMNRVHARRLTAAQIAAARVLIAGVIIIEMTQPVLARSLLPFPLAVRTLDSLHLATMDFLRSQGQPVELASYDQRLLTASAALGFAAAPL